jgi:hypothetical protein
MDNPIPEHVGGIKTLFLALSALGTAYSLSKAEPMPLRRAIVYALISWSAGIIAGMAMLDNWPAQQALAFAVCLLIATVGMPLLPVAQEALADNIRKMRFPWSKE